MQWTDIQTWTDCFSIRSCEPLLILYALSPIAFPFCSKCFNNYRCFKNNFKCTTFGRAQ